MNKLKEYCLNITDGEHGSIPDVADSEYYFLNNNNITDNGIVINPTDRKISKADFDRIHKRTQLSIGDVVIASCGTIGKTQVIKDTDIKYDFSRSVGIIKCDTSKLLPEFLHFYFKNPETQKRIMRASEGAVQKHFYIGAMENFDVDIPDLNEQQRIVQCLSAIDSKITNNTSICSELESMAKLLYDYWFVQFDFPDENGRPYKSSGGKMIWNDELKREIPAGWKAGVLGDVIEKYTDGISSSNIGDLPYTPMDILPMRQMSFSETGSQEDANSSLIRYKKYSLLFGAMRPYFHRVCIAPFDGITRTTVFTLKERGNGELGYAFETLDQDYTVNYANAHHVGTQQPYAEWDGNLEKCPIPLPSAELRRKYSQMISDYIDVVIERNLENKQLASLRDFLLPMLMNGQVKVGKAGE